MKFEFDPEKSLSNKAKHDIDFMEAQDLWLDPYLISIKVETADEPRELLIGMIEEKVWSAIITRRAERIRLISVRRARKSEVKLYEQIED